MAIAKNVKFTSKDSPAIRTGKANPKPASATASQGTSAADARACIEDGETNKLYGDTIGPGTPAMMTSVGNRQIPAKTKGIETRGNGAATKGRIARGPMA
jgi:hypothetical protein